MIIDFFFCILDDTLLALIKLRQHDLENFRGNGRGEREDWDRIYDYDFWKPKKKMKNVVAQKKMKNLVALCWDYPRSFHTLIYV